MSAAQKVLIILGHPDHDSLCAAIADRYRMGVELAGHQVETILVSDLVFDPVMHHYSHPMSLEPDLLRVQAQIAAAHHIALIYPIWWGGMPGLFKSLLDRMLTPGFGLRYTNGTPQGLLTGRTMDVINTTDTPPIAQWYYLRGDKLQMKRAIFGLCGIKIRRFIRFGSVHTSSAERRQHWLVQAEEHGRTAI
jgi:NAD(P)H dehydrogenase (quinone)